MNYLEHYKRLYQKAKERGREFKNENECVESHHFIPRSLFGDEGGKYLIERLVQNIMI